MGIVLLIFGAVAVAGGVWGKEFYAADVITLAEYKQRRSAWSGRVIFIVVGVGLMAIGFKLILDSR